MSARMMVVAFAWLSLAFLQGCEQPKKEPVKPSSPAAQSPPASPAAESKAAEESKAEAKAEKQEKDEDVTELKITELKAGAGAEAKVGKMVSVHYRGRLIDGTEFDSSFRRNEPFQFRLGAGQVIRGWDDGVEGMKVGGKRKLVIPPHLGYGPTGAGGVIPPNATLIFEVELLDVK